ncbi:hypothetical protein F4604DRAFT_1956340 [Suillus subluteus]|nr:hypothetical protein F4604DRAFT_1956340 [Suillus subluteus]
MNVITLSATDFPIKSVKIFSSRTDVAEVTRVFPLHFTQSLNESQAIEISNLPLLCSPHSGIRASVTIGSDDLLVMDYYHDSSDYKSNLFGRVYALRGRASTKATKLRLPVDVYGIPLPREILWQTLARVDPKSFAVLDQQIKDVQKEIDKETQRLFLDSRSLATKATVILAPVSGRTATTAELELKYRVSATWKPVYEIHVTTIDSAPSSSVVLTYRCQISQSTGENWDNVELAVTTAELRVPSVGLPEPKKMEIRQQGFLWQPDSNHQPAVRPIGPRVTPFWNTPGHASPFGNILSSTQQVGQSIFGSNQSVPHQADPSQDSTGAAQGPAADNVFGAFQGQPTTTSTSLFGALLRQSTATTQGLFASAPAQSSTLASRMSEFSHFPTQSQSSSSTILPSSPHPSTAQNSSVSSFGGSTATENTLGFNKPTPNLQQSQPLFASAQPSPSQQQRERAVLGELDKAITHTATFKSVHSKSCKGGDPSRSYSNHPIEIVHLQESQYRALITASFGLNYVLTPGTIHTYLDGRHISDSDITAVLDGKAITTHTIYDHYQKHAPQPCQQRHHSHISYRFLWTLVLQSHCKSPKALLTSTQARCG